MSEHRPYNWDPRVSFEYLEVGGLYAFAYDTDYNDNPKRWFVCLTDPRLSPTTPTHQVVVRHDQPFITLDKFRMDRDISWLEMLHPIHGRCWFLIRDFNAFGTSVDPLQRVFVEV